mgnify:CR=1 FL=1
MSDEPEFLVAEIRGDWIDGQSSWGLVSEGLEEVIGVNYQRGYLLHSFTLSQCATGPRAFTETIVAVFRRVGEEAFLKEHSRCREREHDEQPAEEGGEKQ